jgi:hypothetical protein
MARTLTVHALLQCQQRVIGAGETRSDVMSNTTPQPPNGEPVEPEEHAGPEGGRSLRGGRGATSSEQAARSDNDGASLGEPSVEPSSVEPPAEAPAAEPGYAAEPAYSAEPAESERAAAEPTDVAGPTHPAEPPVPAPVAAAYEGGPLRSGNVGAGAAAGNGGTGTIPVDDPSATWAPEPPPPAAPAAGYAPTGQAATTPPVTEHVVTPVYVSAPIAPKAKGNRGAGILIALLATVVYAIVSALVVLVIFELTKRGPEVAMRDFTQYLGTPSFYVPIIVFALAFILLIAIVNRGGWWAYVLGAFVVAVIVYFAYVGSVLLTIQAWQYTPQEVGRILSQLWANPLTLAAAIIAREVPIWFGAWIAARGRKVRERNIEARAAYERELAAGPQPIQRAG